LSSIKLLAKVDHSN